MGELGSSRKGNKPHEKLLTQRFTSVTLPWKGSLFPHIWRAKRREEDTRLTSHEAKSTLQMAFTLKSEL